MHFCHNPYKYEKKVGGGGGGKVKGCGGEINQNINWLGGATKWKMMFSCFCYEGGGGLGGGGVWVYQNWN